MEFWKKDISQIEFDLKSRDEIPKLMIGLQYIYSQPVIREKVFSIERFVPGSFKKSSKQHLSNSYQEAFQGNIEAKKYTVAAIIRLGEINRIAMINQYQMTIFRKPSIKGSRAWREVKEFQWRL